VAREVTVPAFAIGGIHLENLAEVLATGIQRVAVASAIWKAPSAGEAAAEFLRQLPRAAPFIPASLDAR
jgi:thiamine-phosphate pyrophosphorylase